MVEYARKKYLTYACGSERNIRPSGARPLSVTLQGLLPPKGRVLSGRIILSEPQHMTDTKCTKMVNRLNLITQIYRQFYKDIFKH
jgi:hypothetical protein